MKREIIATGDGSSTIYIPEWNEHYHSSHGALQEAQHVFIANGLNRRTEDYLTVFEMGFGTGLNALLTFFSTEKRNQYIHYIGLEAYPPTEEEWRAMNYADFSKDESAPQVYEALNLAQWNKETPISEHFIVDKRHCKLQELELAASTVDLVYYDAFGPRVQPELWTTEMFERIYRWLAPGGILVTYCAKGQVKRDLKAVGFTVENLPGPPGKREMTRAIKPL